MKIKIASYFSGVAGIEKLFTEDDAFEVDSFSEIDKHPSAVLKYHHPYIENLGDITNIQVNKLRPVDVLLAGFPCFRYDTLIYTLEGYKPISEVVVGDYVLTHRNRFKKVYKVGTNKTETLILKSQGKLDTITTSEHPYLTISKSKGRNSRVIDENEKWTEVKELTKNNFLAIPILKTNSDSDVSNQDLWLSGRFIADGYCYEIKRRENQLTPRTVFCVGYKKELEFDSMISGYQKTVTKSPDVTVIKYILSNRESYDYFSQFGKGAENKKFPQWIMDLPKNRLKIVLDGYLSGDGHVKKSGVISASSVNKELIMQLSLIVAKVYNVGFTVYRSDRNKKTVIEGREVNQKTSYTIEFKKEQTKQSRYFVNERVWMPLTSVEPTGLVETVYNFSVEEDESYVANNTVVHNCTGVSTQGKQEGKGNKKTALVSFLYPIIKQSKPKFIVLENVKNLLSKDMKGLYDEVKNQIEKQGYYCYTETKDSSKYGSSQQRIRVLMYFVRKDFKEARKNYHTNGKQRPIKIKSFTRCLNKNNKYISWSKSHRTNKDKETGEVTKHLDFRIREDGLINTLTTGSGCVGASTGTIVMLPDGSTRYLTPEEGEGLQTWERSRTKYGIDEEGKKYNIPESARYRMIGNGVPSNIVIHHREEIKYLMGLK